jgi:GTP-binding protein
MIPVIALVGRPNVGKSTLFNQLTRSRDALVANFPGLTRDRKYGEGRLGDRPYIVIDTGGISGDEEGIDSQMAGQSRAAIEEADAVLLMVDAREGLNPADQALARHLRQRNKAFHLVVNKIDGVNEELATSEFYALGVESMHAIAATHGRGLRAMMDKVLAEFPEPGPEPGGETRADSIRVAVVGRPNVGKSTLINRLLGEERLVACDSPGTTRDSVHVPFERDGRPYTLIDTAGVRRRAKVRDAVEKFSVIKTLQAIEECNVVILVIDARQGIGEQDATLAAHIVDSGRALVVAVNKWDGLDDDARKRVKDALRRKLGFLDFASAHFISALHGSGVGLLLREVDRAYCNAVRDLSTPELTRILEAAVQEHQPPLARGRRIKLRYAHQGGRNPPIIVIHGNQTADVPESYRRYLVNRYRRELDLTGTPLRLELRTGSNPFQGRRNRLSPSQQRKRTRLKRFVQRRR